MAKKVDNQDIYIDPLSDFGFKRLFGDKELMISFLNCVLNIEDTIEDLHYGNTVRTGISKDDRAVIFDLYCTTKKGERIIVEMQTMSHDNYKERTVYYASRLIQDQAKRGKDWDFALQPVYSVNITNFNIDEELTDKSYLSHIQFMYKGINKPYYNKLTIIYLELPRFTKKESELKTNVEQWVYALKYLPKLAKMPTALRNEIFGKLFELAQIAKMTKKEQNAYYKSLHDMGIVKNEIAKRDRTIFAQGNTITAQGNTITAQAQRIAELERQLGINGTSAKKVSLKSRL